MVYELPEDGRETTEQQRGGTDGGGGGGGCGAGQFETSIGPNGEARWGPGCVDAAERDRRYALFNQLTAGNGEGGGGQVGSQPTQPAGSAQYKVPNAPAFNAPKWGFTEQFAAPTFDEAYNDPGYKFAEQAGLRAIQQSQAAKGGARTGGALKNLSEWNSDFATQRYGDVFNRKVTGFNTRLGAYSQKFGADYQGARDEYAPSFAQWQAQTNFGSQAARDAWLRQWQNWDSSTLTAYQLAQLAAQYGG